VCYSADGSCILAAGKSKNVCIYSVPDQMLMKKFEITCNMSFDGMEVTTVIIYFIQFLFLYPIVYLSHSFCCSLYLYLLKMDLF